MGSLVYGHPQNHATGAFRPRLVPSVSVNAYDSDAQVFITASGITDPPQQSAISTLVTGLKTSGLWTKMRAIYPFVGGTSASHSVNLKSPGTYNISWSGGITHDANGVQGNGSTGYGNTGLNPRSVLTLNDAHISVYSRTDSAIDAMDVGAFDGTQFLGMYCKYTDSKAYGYHNDPNDGGAAQIAAAANASSAAMYTLTRTAVSAGASSLYRNSTVGATTGNNNIGYLHPNTNVFLLARSNSGSATGYSNRQVAFASVGDGLTSTDVSNLYTLVQAYQTDLGRQV